MTAPCIPNDIMVDILLLLPASYLLRLRWTCTYWYDLITRDPDFIKMHIHRSTTHNEIIKNSPCVLIMNDNGNLFKLYFNYTTYNASPKVDLDFPFEYNRNSFTMLSSCNGLILFSYLSSTRDARLCIWNPCTKEYKVLPEPFKCIGEEVCYGFGYDHTIDDYKVIKNAYHCKYYYNEGTNSVQVYTLRANTWRSFGPTIPKNIGCLERDGVFVNGALYWITSKGLVMSFDIEKEKYQQVSKVPGDIMAFWTPPLGVFDGSLSCLSSKYDRNEMWVMNMETNSWTEFCKMPEIPLRKRPLSFDNNGDSLMVWGWGSEDLILFNTKTKTSTNLNICEGHLSVQEVYIESLVSLNSGIYACGDKLK